MTDTKPIGNAKMLEFAADNGPYEIPHHANTAWRVLIVDDDPEIHKVTALALRNVTIQRGGLQLIHCYNEQQAHEALAAHRDIAVIMLDVVMEHTDTGLNLIRYIRDELNRGEPRIILRTGQPGLAPEEQIVREYDIQDYKTKTELTRTQLITSLSTAIRAYRHLSTLNQLRYLMASLLRQTTRRLPEHPLNNFSTEIIRAAIAQLGLQASGFLALQHQKLFQQQLVILGGSAPFSGLQNKPLYECHDHALIKTVTRALDEEKEFFSEHCLIITFTGDDYRGALYLDSQTPLNRADYYLMHNFIGSVRIALENILLLKNLQHTAYNDDLTPLANRAGFLYALKTFASAPLEQVVVLLDIAHFSELNDGLGAQAGNALLIGVAERLKEALHECQLARIGADIFAIMGPARQLSPSLLTDLFSYPFLVDGNQVLLRAHFGVCTQDQASPEPDTLLRQAWTALNQAKQENQDPIVYFQQSMEDKSRQRLDMLRKLREDFAAGQLELWFQPQISLADGKITGMEGLLRWRHEGQFISPAEFIPLAEQSGLIVEIGLWVLEQACEVLQTLKQQGCSLRVSVNVSVQQFYSTDFVERVRSTIARYDITPADIELEITESVIIDDPQFVVGLLNQLKQLGVTLAIDDFGTGFSSLSYLQSLPLDCIKIDRSFVSIIANDNDVSPIVELIIDLSKKLQMTTIAEGIETPLQANYLRQRGCQGAQGYLFAKPMPEPELVEFLAHYQPQQPD